MTPISADRLQLCLTPPQQRETSGAQRQAAHADPQRCASAGLYRSCSTHPTPCHTPARACKPARFECFNSRHQLTPIPALPGGSSLHEYHDDGLFMYGTDLSESYRMMRPPSRRVPSSGGDCDASHKCRTHLKLLAPSSLLAADCSAGSSVHAAAETGEPAGPVAVCCQQRTVPSTPELGKQQPIRATAIILPIRECNPGLFPWLLHHSVLEQFNSVTDRQHTGSHRQLPARR